MIDEHAELVDKVYKLMTKLNTIKNRYHLREIDALMPVFKKSTRWSSTCAPQPHADDARERVLWDASAVAEAVEVNKAKKKQRVE